MELPPRSNEWQSPRRRSETEIGVLTAISVHGRNPNEERPVIGVEVTQTHIITAPPGEARTRLLIRQLLIYVLMVPHLGEMLSQHRRTTYH
ncbi:hypothetical protein AVEN_193033-1 [Araneus ventricosus]|uniref:Uncharacterized protein n=1 Tax=Araneus ventricosus TaxID=182803 RepID=A0A4Y2QCW0_ARAVE|nr:hypothetical protein AVEN_193033-1 [Araneus ventricosus]